MKPHAAVADRLHRGGKLQLHQFQFFLKTSWSWSVYSDKQCAIHSSKQYFYLSFLSLNSFIVDINMKRNLNYFYCVKFSNYYLLLQFHTLLSGPISWQYLSLLIWKNLLLAHHLSNGCEISSVMLTNWLWLYSVNEGYTRSFKRGIYKGQWLDTQIKHNTISRYTSASIRLCLYSLSLTSPEQQYLQRIPSRQRAMTPLPDALSTLHNQAGLFWVIFWKMIDLYQSSRPLKKLFLGHSHQQMSIWGCCTGRAGSASVHMRLRQLLWTGPC